MANRKTLKTAHDHGYCCIVSFMYSLRDVPIPKISIEFDLSTKTIEKARAAIRSGELACCSECVGNLLTVPDHPFRTRFIDSKERQQRIAFHIDE